MSKKRTIIIASAAFIAGLALALAPVAVNAAQKIFDQSMSITRDDHQFLEVHRYDDPDFQVKCWTVEEYRGNAITCLPWNEVKER